MSQIFSAPQKDTLVFDGASAILTPSAPISIKRASGYSEVSDAAFRLTGSKTEQKVFLNSSITLTNSASTNLFGVDGLSSKNTSFSLRAVNNLTSKTLKITSSATSGTTAPTAYGIASAGTLNIGGRTDDIFRTSINLSISSKEKGATAYAFYAKTLNACDIAGSIAVSAVSQKAAALANGLYSVGAMTAGTIAKDIAVSGSGNTANAYGLNAGGTLTLDGLTGKLTVGATSNTGSANASGIYSDGAMTLKSISKSIAVTAKGVTASEASGLYSKGTLNADSLSGAITVNGNSSDAQGSGIYSDGAMTLKSVSGAIAVTANGKTNGIAAGICAYNSTLNLTELSGKISVTANVSSSTGTAPYTVGVMSHLAMTVGTISNSITLSSKSGAYINMGGLLSEAAMTVADLSGSISVSGVSKNDMANVCGLSSTGKMTIGTALKNISVSADAKVTAAAFGLHSKNALEIEQLSGKISVKATASSDYSSALGLDSANAMTLGKIAGNITVSAAGKSSAYAYSTGILSKGTLDLDSLSGGITSSSKAVSNYALSMCINASSSAITIGTISKALKVDAASTKTHAYAFGIFSGTLNTGSAEITGGGKITIDTIKQNITVSASAGSNVYSNANAYAGGILGLGVKVNTISSALTVKSHSDYGNVNSYGLDSCTGAMTLGTISSAITVSAGGKSANAYGFHSGDTLSLTTFSGKLTVSANGGNSDTYGFLSKNAMTLGEFSGAISIKNNGYAEGFVSLAGAMTLETLSGNLTVSGSLSAYGVHALGSNANGNISLGTVSGNISVSSTKESNGIYSTYQLTGLNLFSGKLTVTASGYSDSKAIGIYAYYSMTIGTVSNAVTVTAKGYSANSYGFFAGSSEPATSIVVNQLSGKLTVSAASSSSLAYARGFLSYFSGVTLGTVSKAVSVSASGRGAYAYGISSGDASYGGGAINLLTGAVGNWTVKATGGSSETEAIGWRCYGSINTADAITGKLTVSSSGSAIGIRATSIVSGTFSASKVFTADGKAAHLNADISVTGKTATAIWLTGASNLVIEDASVAVHVSSGGDSSASYAIRGGDSAQTITLEKDAKVSGRVSLGAGSDALIMRSGSGLTGDVQFGDGSDSLHLYSGSKLRGKVEGLEAIAFHLDNIDYMAQAMLQTSSAIDQLSTTAKTVDINSGLQGDFVLATASSSTNWSTQFGSVSLYVDGTNVGTLNFGASLNYDSFQFTLDTSRDKKSVIVSVDLAS